MDKLVSIIMPTYKGAQNIYETAKSVLNQTYSSFELIIVDDNGVGSLQQLETEKVLSDLMKDSRLNYVKHEENKNGSVARNTGIKVSKGEYIAFLDDDDIFYPDKIQKQVQLFETLPESYGLVYGGLLEKYSESYSKEIITVPERDFLFEYLSGKLYVCSSTVIIKKSVIDTIGYWDESFVRHQDMEFITRVASVYKVTCLNEICIEKIRLDRSLPQNGAECEKLRLHYLERMKEIIDQFSDKDKSIIYDFNYISLGKVYLKNKDLRNTIKWSIKTSNLFRTLSIYIQDAISFTFRKILNYKPLSKDIIN